MLFRGIAFRLSRKIRDTVSRDEVYTVPFVMQLVRPVMNVTDAVQVQFKLKISQLIDVVSY